MTIKATIALEFSNRRHRDEFLKAFQMAMFTFGNKAPKCKITTKQETECEFGDPSALDLHWMGVETPAIGITPLEAWELAQQMMRTRYSPAAVGSSPQPAQPPDAGPELEAAADASDDAREEAAMPASLRERVLQALATYGPLTVATLAMHLTSDPDAVEYELEQLKLVGDVEPDDGNLWRLVDAE